MICSLKSILKTFPFLLLLLMAINLISCDSKKEEAGSPESTELDNKKETVSKEAADVLQKADEAEDVTDEDFEEDVEVEEDVPQSSTQKTTTEKLYPVYMGVWGNVGGTCFNFDMNGTTGSYIPYDLAEAKEYGARRQLKLVSYDPRTGKCVINAFLKGAYIGRFDGIFKEDEFETDDGGQHTVQQYNGIFTSVKGAKLDFNMHFD